MVRSVLITALCAFALGTAQAQEDRPFLGVSCDTDDGAVVVTDVYDGTTADKLGLRDGDRLVKFNGEAVSNVDTLIGQIRQVRPGKTFGIEVHRGDQRLSLRGKMGSRAKWEAQRAAAERAKADAEKQKKQAMAKKAKKQKAKQKPQTDAERMHQHAMKLKGKMEKARAALVQARQQGDRKKLEKAERNLHKLELQMAELTQKHSRNRGPAREAKAQYHEQADKLQRKWEDAMLNLEEAVQRDDQKRIEKAEKAVVKLERAMQKHKEKHERAMRERGARRGGDRARGKARGDDKLARAERELKMWVERERQRIQAEAKEQLAQLQRQARQKMQALRREMAAQERAEAERARARAESERARARAEEGRRRARAEEGRSRARGGDRDLNRRMDRLEDQMSEIRELLGELLKRR